MNLLVVGASGKTGIQVVRQALEAGHKVTAFVRDPAKLSVREGVTVKTGDARNAPDLRAALPGQDAAIVTIGSARGHLIDPAMAALVQAADETGVRRVVLMASYMVAPSFKASRTDRLLGGAMKGFFEDIRSGVARLRGSDLDWTVVYATGLTNDARSRRERVVPDTVAVTSKNKIARADVAAVLLDRAVSGTDIGGAFVVTRD